MSTGKGLAWLGFWLFLGLANADFVKQSKTVRPLEQVYANILSSWFLDKEVKQ